MLRAENKPHRQKIHSAGSAKGSGEWCLSQLRLSRCTPRFQEFGVLSQGEASLLVLAATGTHLVVLEPEGR